MASGGRRLTVAALALALAGVGLTGCSGDDSSTPSPEKTPSTPSARSSVQGNLDLPPNYPNTEAPILPGGVVGVQQGEVDGQTRWQVLIQTSKSPDAALAAAAGLLAKAGWSAGSSSGSGQELTRGDETVEITAEASDGKTQLAYVVTLS